MGVLRDHPELALFLCLAAGHLLGKLRAGPIALGGICGTLIVSLLVGTQHIIVDEDVRTVFFALFIFALGYMGGPQFFANLTRPSRSARSQAASPWVWSSAPSSTSRSTRG